MPQATADETVEEGDVAATSAQGRSRAVVQAFISGAGAKIGSLIAQLVAIGVAARTLDTADLGVLVTLTAVSGILGFFDLGIGNAAITEFARLHSKGDEGALRRSIAAVLCTLGLLGVLLVVGAVGMVLLLPMTAVNRALVLFVLISACAMPASLGARLALGQQNGRQNNLVMVVASASVLAAAFISSVLHADLFVHVLIFIGLPVLANGMQTLLLLSGRLQPLWSGVTICEIRRLVRLGLPFAGLALAGAAAYQSDALIVATVLGPAAAVGFGMLMRMFNGLTVLFMGGLQQMWASTAHALEAGDYHWVTKTFRRTFAVTMGLYVAADVALLLLAPWIVHLWSDEQASVSRLLVLVFIVWNTYSFAMSQCSMLLNGAGAVLGQAVLVLAMAVINVPLSIGLASAWGAAGPLAGSTISHVLIVGGPLALWTWRLLSRGRPAATAVAQKARASS